MKDVYDIIEHSYHKEYLMDLERMSGKTISLALQSSCICNSPF